MNLVMNKYYLIYDYDEDLPIILLYGWKELSEFFGIVKRNLQSSYSKYKKFNHQWICDSKNHKYKIYEYTEKELDY